MYKKDVAIIAENDADEDITVGELKHKKTEIGDIVTIKLHDLNGNEIYKIGKVVEVLY
jgi:glycine cleavage system H lipoate-binding protein